MREYIDNHTKRQEKLKSLIRELHRGKSVDDVKSDFAELVRGVSAAEISAMEQALIAEGMPESEIKRLCDVHVEVFRESLDEQVKEAVAPGHPVHTFRAENAAAAKVLEALGEAVEAVKANPAPAHLKRARERLAELLGYDRHYERKENILFPYLERHGFSGPSAVMWAIHDDVRAGWKALDKALAEGPSDDASIFAARIDALFEPMGRAMREMFYKEENILFPTALEMLNEAEWLQIRGQEAEIGHFRVHPGESQPTGRVGAKPAAGAKSVELEPSGGGAIQLDTGMLTAEEINWLLTNLPVDVTYVGKDDAVRYFSQTRERIFPRSPAIIGREVQRCHPPASVHRVQQILDDFRAGRSDVAEFWIQMGEKFIHIRYFAIRSDDGEYQGTLEVSQDVSGIRKLEGEKRLLDDARCAGCGSWLSSPASTGSGWWRMSARTAPPIGRCRSGGRQRSCPR